MWHWILIGAGAYVVLLIVVVAVAASARGADRRERAMFASRVAEKRKRIVPVPALRTDHPRAA